MGTMYSDVELIMSGAVMVPDNFFIRFDGERLPVEFGEYIVDSDGSVYVRMGEYFVPFDDAEVADRYRAVSFEELCESMVECVQ